MEKATANRLTKHGQSITVMVFCIACLVVTFSVGLLVSSIIMINSSIIASNVSMMINVASIGSAQERLIRQETLEQNSKVVADDDEIPVIQLTPYDQDTLDFTILPDELPGYTGWARPVTTLAASFRIVNVSAPYATAGKEWSVLVKCVHPACLKGGSLFYLRAYGRSVLPGRVTDHQNGQYTFTILPHDAGRYTLEVVLTFSQRPNWTQLPLPSPDDQPLYEGFLLPDFPLQFSVVQGDESSRKEQSLLQIQQSPISSASQGRYHPALVGLQPKSQQPPTWCTAHQLVETSLESALATGRWLVVNKTRSLPFIMPSMTENLSYADTEQINIETYTDGLASLGFQMDYFPLNCDLLPLSHFTKPETWLTALKKLKNYFSKQVIHILFVGDSNTRNQYNFWRDTIAQPTDYFQGQMRLTYVDMIDTWEAKFPPAKKKLLQVTHNYKDDLFFTIFNVGLHEIRYRCAFMGHKPKDRCYGLYQKDVQELVDLIQSLPSMLNVWQTTMAAWPKWGLYGVPWPRTKGQNFPNEPNICGYINELAWDVVNKSGIPIMDTYWLTLSRSDHRQVLDHENANMRTFYKLVHPGLEVYNVLVRKTASMILEAIEKGTSGKRYL